MLLVSILAIDAVAAGSSGETATLICSCPGERGRQWVDEEAIFTSPINRGPDNIARTAWWWGCQWPCAWVREGERQRQQERGSKWEREIEEEDRNGERGGAPDGGRERDVAGERRITPATKTARKIEERAPVRDWRERERERDSERLKRER